MKSSSRLACLLAYVTLSTTAFAQTSATQAYNLAEGTRLEFQTSGKLEVSGAVQQKQEGSVNTTYTVVNVSGGERTLFAATDSVDAKSGKIQPGARFTFTLKSDGTAGTETAGFAQPPMDGWTFTQDFPPVPAEGAATVPMILPLSGMPVETTATRTQQGSDVAVTLEWKKEASDAPPQGVQMESYKLSYVYSPAARSVKSSQMNLKASGAGPGGQKINLAVDLESKQTGAGSIEKDKLAAVQKSIKEGLPIAENIGMMVQSGAEGTSKALEALTKHMTDNPDSPFTPMFTEMRNQIKVMTDLTANAEKVKEGEAAPLFEVTTTEGEKLKLADLKGKVVLLDFWATWCGPCRMEMPNVVKVYEANKDKGFTVVGLSADRELDDLLNYVKQEKIPWKQVFEPEPKEGTAMHTYGIMKYPTTVLIDREGTIRAVDVRGEELGEAVQDLVSAK